MIRFACALLGALCLIYTSGILVGVVVAVIYIDATITERAALSLIGMIFSVSAFAFGLLLIEDAR